MNSKDKAIIVLFVTGIILFGLVQFVVVPHNERARAKYMAEQMKPETQDLKTIIKYKNKYMGNASNIMNLFNNLPIANEARSFQLHSDKLMFEVNYKEAMGDIGDKKIKKALIYNSTAVFALIDNVQQVKYNFTDASFTVNRKDVQNFYGNLNSLLQEDNWKKDVQKKLYNDEYVSQSFDKLIQKDK